MGRLGRVWVGSLFDSGQLRVKYVQVRYGFGLGKVRIRIYFGLIMFGSGMGSDRLKFGSSLFWVARR